MLNPSTADEKKLDPTCSRARDYAERWGYGALIVTNVFAFRETSPEKMKQTLDPIGPGNDAAIVRAAKASALVVCAWGNHGVFLERSFRVRALLNKNKIKLHSLRINANGEPAHPFTCRGRSNLRLGRLPRGHGAVVEAPRPAAVHVADDAAVGQADEEGGGDDDRGDLPTLVGRLEQQRRRDERGERDEGLQQVAHPR